MQNNFLPGELQYAVGNGRHLYKDYNLAVFLFPFHFDGTILKFIGSFRKRDAVSNLGLHHHMVNVIQIGVDIQPRQFGDKQIDDIKNDNKEGYRKQSEGEWIDRYNGKYANSLYVCSFCDERAPLYIKADELGNEQIVQMLSQFCPNCGAKMKGGSE